MPRSILYDNTKLAVAKIVKGGKRLQIGCSFESAYQIASDVMACNMGHEDATEGIEAFLGKRSADSLSR